MRRGISNGYSSMTLGGQTLGPTNYSCFPCSVRLLHTSFELRECASRLTTDCEKNNNISIRNKTRHSLIGSSCVPQQPACGPVDTREGHKSHPRLRAWLRSCRAEVLAYGTHSDTAMGPARPGQARTTTRGSATRCASSNKCGRLKISNNTMFLFIVFPSGVLSWCKQVLSFKILTYISCVVRTVVRCHVCCIAIGKFCAGFRTVGRLCVSPSPLPFPLSLSTPRHDIIETTSRCINAAAMMLWGRHTVVRYTSSSHTNAGAAFDSIREHAFTLRFRIITVKKSIGEAMSVAC